MYDNKTAARFVIELFLCLTLLNDFCFLSQSLEDNNPTIARYARFYRGGAIQCQFTSNRCVAFDWQHITSIFKRSNNVKKLKVYEEVSRMNSSYYKEFKKHYPAEFAQYLIDEHFKKFYTKYLLNDFISKDDLTTKADKLCHFFGFILSTPDAYHEKCNATFSDTQTNEEIPEGILTPYNADFMEQLASPKVHELIASQNNDATFVLEHLHPDRYESSTHIFNNVLVSQCHISLKDFEKLDKNNDFRKSVIQFMYESLKENLDEEECSIVLSNRLDLSDDVLAERWMKNNEVFMTDFIGFLINKTLPCLKLALGVEPGEDVHSALINFCRGNRACYMYASDGKVDPFHLKYLVDKLANLLIEKLSRHLGSIVREACENRHPPTLPFPDFPLLMALARLDEEEYTNLNEISSGQEKPIRRDHNISTSSTRSNWRAILHQSTQYSVGAMAILLLVSIPIVIFG